MKKKQTVLAFLSIFAGIWISGCGQNATGEWKANENSIYVNREQNVQSALVYTSESDNDLYDQEELAAFVQEAIEGELTSLAGNGEIAVLTEELQQKPPVTLTSCTLEGRTGMLIFEYASPEYYGTFAELAGDNTNTVRNLTVLSAADESAARVLPDADLKKANGKTVKPEEVLKHEDYTIVVFEGAGTICTEGKIMCVSADSDVVLKDDFTAVTGEGRHCIVFK